MSRRRDDRGPWYKGAPQAWLNHNVVALGRARPSRRSRVFFSVVVFRSLRALREYERKQWRTTGAIQGVCHSWTRTGYGKDRRPKPSLGLITLARGYCTMRILSHECTHAAVTYAVRRRWPLGDMVRGVAGTLPYDSLEERFCRALGSLASDCVNITTRVM